MQVVFEALHARKLGYDDSLTRCLGETYDGDNVGMVAGNGERPDPGGEADAGVTEDKVGVDAFHGEDVAGRRDGLVDSPKVAFANDLGPMESIGGGLDFA